MQAMYVDTLKSSLKLQKHIYCHLKITAVHVDLLKIHFILLMLNFTEGKHLYMDRNVHIFRFYAFFTFKYFGGNFFEKFLLVTNVVLPMLLKNVV